MIAISPEQLEPDPLEIDGRPCELCGLKIDKHERVDSDEGPIFFCEDDLEIQIHLAAADLVRQWELADPRDAWRHTGEPPPKPSGKFATTALVAKTGPEPYRMPDSVIDAFWYVAGLNDPDRLKAWLLNHPKDAPHLHKLWKAKR
jgi:hypothetical protein